MSGHTPGPWRVDPRCETHVEADGRGICSVSWHRSDDPACRGENIANARLIAAAPEMLELLAMQADAWMEYRRAYESVGGGHISTGIRWKRLTQLEDRARALLARIDGEPDK